MSSVPDSAPLFADRFRCPVCRKLQFHAEPTEGTGFYQCQVVHCGTTWWSAIIRQGTETLYLAVVVAGHQRQRFRGRPVAELLRELHLMDDVQRTPAKEAR